MYEAVSTRETEDKKGWVTYGAGNDYPNYLIDLYYSAPYHNALCNSIASMIAGDGLFASGAGAFQLATWGTNKYIDNICSDLKIQGGFYLEVILTADKKGVARVNHLPFENCRVSYSEDTDKINGVWYSRDWKNTTKKNNKPVFIPLFTALPTEDSEDTPVRYAVYAFRQAVGSMYYPKPDYIGGLNYIELSRQIGLYHVNNIMNGFFPSIIVQFNNGQPDGNGADIMTRDFENKISGARNAGKAIFLFNDNKDAAATFETFPIPDADKHYEHLATQSVEATMVAHGVTSPLLFGVKDPNGFSSTADEMTEGLRIFMEKRVEPYRRMIADALEYIMQIVGVESTISFEAPVVESNIEAPSEAADKSYNGAQIVSAIAILENVKNGILTEEQAIVFLVQFLNLPQEIAQSFFAVKPEDRPALLFKHHLSQLQKKKVCCSVEKSNDFNDEKAIEYLTSVAEEIDSEEWEEYDSDIVVPAFDTIAEEQAYIDNLSNKITLLANAGSFANGDKKSDLDVGLYKLRYSYSQNISQDSRQFCKQMVALAQAGKVFRYEDIIAMGDAGVNEQFAPAGSSTYSIWEWKGGVYCHHKFERRIYFRKREGGKFLPNDGLKNDVRVGNVPFVQQKGVESVAPINTPTRGSLKYA